MRNFRGKLRAALAVAGIRAALRRPLPGEDEGFHEWLPELRAILAEGRGFARAGHPVLRRVDLPRGPVTLITIAALEEILPAIRPAELAISVKVELAERHRAIKRDGCDSLLRAALIQKFGPRQEATQ